MIGGLAIATLATLFFVPVVFRMVHRHPEAREPEVLDAAIPETTSQ